MTDLYPGGLTRGQAVAWRNGVFIVFGLCGLAMASWMARIPAVKQALGVTTAEMGILLFGVALGSILGLLVSSHVIARFGTRTVMSVGLVAAALGLVIAGFGITVGGVFAVAFAGLCLFGASMGMSDVAMNLSGAVNERVLGRNVMPIFHAFFSLGTMLGAGLGALAELAQVPLLAQCAGIGIVMAVAGIVAVRFTRSEHVIHQADNDGESDHSTWRERLAIWRDPRTLLIGLIVLGMAFAEGSANDWLALTMVDGHHVDKPTGAVVFGVFVTAMTVGRLAGVRVLDHYGRVPVLRGSALLAIVGLVMVIFVPVTWVAVVGVVLWGLGERFGLLNGLLVVLVLIGVAGAASHAAREPRPVIRD